MPFQEPILSVRCTGKKGPKVATRNAPPQWETEPEAPKRDRDGALRTGFNVNNPKPGFHGLQTSHKLQYLNFLFSVSLSVCLFPPTPPPPVTFNYFLYSESFLLLGHPVQGELDYP